MNRSGLAAIAIASLAAAVACAADATTPIDYTQRNSPFAVGAASAVTPETQKPATNAAVQDKRFEKPAVEKQMAPVAGRRADIQVTDTRDKRVQDKESKRPEKREQPTSAFNHRPAAISTNGDTTKPPTVAKYQDSLTAASASNMARFPALDQATSARINRFVFRKNPPDASASAQGKPVVPAAGRPADTTAARANSAP